MLDAGAGKYHLPLRSYIAVLLSSIWSFRDNYWAIILLFVSAIGLSKQFSLYLIYIGLTLSGVVLIAGYRLYKSYYYSCFGGNLIVSYGVLNERATKVPVASMEKIELKEDYLCLLLGLVSVEVFTSGSSKAATKVPYITYSAASTLSDLIKVKFSGAEDYLFEHKLSLRDSIKGIFIPTMVSLFLPGLTIVAAVLALFTGSGSTTEIDQQDDRFVDTFANTYHLLQEPIVVLGIALFCLLLVATSTLAARLFWLLPQFLKASIRTTGETLSIYSGFPVRKKSSVLLSKVVNVKISNNFLSRLMKGSSVEVFTVSSSKDKFNEKCYIPFVRTEHLDRLLVSIGVNFTKYNTFCTVHPDIVASEMMSFLRKIALALLAGVLLMPLDFLQSETLFCVSLSVVLLLALMLYKIRCINNSGAYNVDRDCVFGDYGWERKLNIFNIKNINAISVHTPLFGINKTSKKVVLGVGHQKIIAVCSTRKLDYLLRCTKEKASTDLLKSSKN